MSDDLAVVHELRSGDVAVIAIAGEIDLSNADEVGARVAGVGDGAPIVIDLSEVDYLDSIGIAMLAGVGPGAHLVAPAEGPAGRLLAMVGLDLPAYEDRASAVRAAADARGMEG